MTFEANIVLRRDNVDSLIADFNAVCDFLERLGAQKSTSPAKKPAPERTKRLSLVTR